MSVLPGGQQTVTHHCGDDWQKVEKIVNSLTSMNREYTLTMRVEEREQDPDFAFATHLINDGKRRIWTIEEYVP